MSGEISVLGAFSQSCLEGRREERGLTKARVHGHHAPDQGRSDEYESISSKHRLSSGPDHHTQAASAQAIRMSAKGRERKWRSSPRPDASDNDQSLSGGSLRENPTGRLSKQCTLAPYNLAPLNPRVDLPTPVHRCETTPIRGLRPIPTCPHAYWPNARRALVFDSLHHPADAARGAVRPNGPN